MPLRRRHRHGSGKVLPQVAAFCKLPLLFLTTSCSFCRPPHFWEAATKENGMRCPVDNETLLMTMRGGVEIDYCPKCRGVWLDRGELDKIIDRSTGASDAMASAPAFAPPPIQQQAAPVYQPEPRAPQGYREESRRRRDDDDDDRRGQKKKRRDSFLSDIFDF